MRLHRLLAPDSGVWCRIGQIDTTPKSLGRVHHMAGGVKRAVVYSAIDEPMNLTIVLADFQVGETLREWVDDVVVTRDPHGRVRVGLLRVVGLVTPAVLPHNRVQGNIGFTLVTHSLEI